MEKVSRHAIGKYKTYLSNPTVFALISHIGCLLRRDIYPSFYFNRDQRNVVLYGLRQCIIQKGL